jgi:hypothetical protein
MVQQDTAALRDFDPVYVRFGSKADIAPCLDFVRFTPESGHARVASRSPAQKVYILHKKLSLSGALCAKPSWAERDDRDHAAKNFFQEGNPKTGHPISPPGPPSAPEIVLRQISRDGAWMNFRFSRALPPGGLAHARPDDLEAFPSGLGHAASGTTYLPR